MFETGYDSIRDKVSKAGKYLMSCYNCYYYFQAPEDEKEMCQNGEVIKYDMVVDENSIYCLKWKPYNTKTQKEKK